MLTVYNVFVVLCLLVLVPSRGTQRRNRLLLYSYTCVLSCFYFSFPPCLYFSGAAEFRPGPPGHRDLAAARGVGLRGPAHMLLHAPIFLYLYI